MKRYEWFNQLTGHDDSLQEQANEIFYEKMKGIKDSSKVKKEAMHDAIHAWLEEEIGEKT